MMTWSHRNLVLLFYRWYFFEIKIIITIIINTYETSELKKNAPLDLTWSAQILIFILSLKTKWGIRGNSRINGNIPLSYQE